MGCKSLQRIDVSEDNMQFTSINGTLFNKEKTKIIKQPQKSQLKENKNNQETKWITIRVNPNPLVDFSGDDLSLDPRFW